MTKQMINAMTALATMADVLEQNPDDPYVWDDFVAAVQQYRLVGDTELVARYTAQRAVVGD